VMNKLGMKYYTEDELRKMGFKSVGKDVRVGTRAIIRDPSIVSIGNHVAIDDFVVILPTVDIGNYVHITRFTSISGSRDSYCRISDYAGISERCSLICGTDDFSGEYLANPTIPIQYRKVTNGRIILEKYVQLGANVTILPNVTIGEGTAVGACSLVTKSLDPWGIYVGIPVIRKKERSRQMVELAKDLEASK